jgi:hypothetical protein
MEISEVSNEFINKLLDKIRDHLINTSTTRLLKEATVVISISYV